MLEYSHVSVSCNHTPILQDINVSFPKGKITTLVGPNGCGKTTLLQCLNGSSQVTSGSITMDGDDYLRIPLRERATRLSFLPQVRTIIPTLPVKTLVEHGRFPYLGFARKKTPHDVELVMHAMEFTHITQYADQSADTLSGGIRQRAFLAMQLAQDCEYMVLDEPTTFLDLKGQREIITMLQELKKQNHTIILVLHDLNQALRISDQLVVMKNRNIIAAGTPEECIKSHVIEDVFLCSVKQFQDEDGSYYFFM